MKKTSFFDAVHYLGNDFIQCDRIPTDDPTYFEGRAALYADDPDAEIYQTFLTDCSDDEVFYLSSRFGLHFAYSSRLCLWVLLVTHLGTAWECVECSDFGDAAEEVSK